MATVYLSRDHVGKPGRDDLGAPGGAGVEALLARGYLAHLEDRLRELGHRIVVLSDGWYQDRHARAGGYARRDPGPWVYLAAHVNAGGGRYGLVGYDARSGRGSELALSIASALGAACPELSDARTVGVASDDEDQWRRNVFATIGGCFHARPVGACLEPFFVDRPEHYPLAMPDGLRRVGQAIAAGVHAALTDWEAT